MAKAMIMVRNDFFFILMILNDSSSLLWQAASLADAEDADARIVGPGGKVGEERLLGFHHLVAVLLEA